MRSDRGALFAAAARLERGVAAADPSPGPAGAGAPLPAEIARWTHVNAALALAAAAGSAALGSLWPSLLAAAGGLGWLTLGYGPRPFGLANGVTAGRFVCIAGAIAAGATGSWLALAAAVGFALDALDGWLARRRDEAGPFGAHFDMETDSQALLLLSLQLMAAGGFGAWLVAIGALRYVYVLARWWRRPALLRERRSRSGRWVFALVCCALIAACLPELRRLAEPLLALALAALLGSFGSDFRALLPGRSGAGRSPRSRIEAGQADPTGEVG